MIDPTQRFTDRVESYVRFRPSYPAEVLGILARDAGLTANAVVADVGSGTGISTKLFLDHGDVVYAVEPNREMRQAAESLFSDNARFHSIDGTAEDTKLLNHSVDFVIAGQAFQWFDRRKARLEFARILRPGGWIVLMWNDRRLESTPFLRGYEALLREFAVDYRQVDHKNVNASVVREFFSPEDCNLCNIDNQQTLDLQGLLGRIASSSYMPSAGHPRHRPTCEAAERLFYEHQQDGLVTIEYDTVFYYGQLIEVDAGLA